MITDAQGRIKFIGPAGKVLWVSKKTFDTKVSRQTLIDMGFSMAKPEAPLPQPVALPPIIEEPAPVVEATEVEDAPKKRGRPRKKRTHNAD